MKIVYFIDHLRLGGTQHVLAQLVRGMAARAHTQTIFCLNDSFDGMMLDELQSAPATVHIVGKAALATGLGVARIYADLKRERYDVAVTLLFASDVVGRFLAHAAVVPRIVTSIRSRNEQYTFWMRRAVRTTMPWADVVVLNSAYQYEFALQEEGAKQDRIIVIHNGVRVEPGAKALTADELRTEFGIAPCHRIIGSVGRLSPEKGFDLLIEGMAQLASQDIDLVLVGDGPLRMQLMGRANALGLAERVHFAGHCRDVPQLLGAFDVYVHPARLEGMPNALLEAMAAGCPIVATTVGGACELIEPGVHGWLVPPNNVAALQVAVSEALLDRDRATRRGKAAQARARTKFSETTMLDAWEQVLVDGR